MVRGMLRDHGARKRGFRARLEGDDEFAELPDRGLIIDAVVLQKGAPPSDLLQLKVAEIW